MASAPYLIFDLHHSLYAIPAVAVREIFELPELTPLRESPPHLVGIINLRGQIVPVIDLNTRLGYGRQPYRLQDSVIVLEDDEELAGIIVSGVRGVKNINEEDIEPMPSMLLSGMHETVIRILYGVAKIDDDVALLLHVENLLKLAEYSEESEMVQEEIAALPTLPDHRFCPDATPADLAVFRDRALNLRQRLVDENRKGSIPLAVVGLNGEYFGIDLLMVREFAALHTMTPVPCCPSHVIGQMNLRGDILTVMDIRNALQMPLDTKDDTDSSTSKVVVIEEDALRIGLLVDEVFDVMNLQPADIHAVPAASRSSNDDYLKGTAAFGEKMLGILNLTSLLHQGALTVNESI